MTLYRAIATCKVCDKTFTIEITDPKNEETLIRHAHEGNHPFIGMIVYEEVRKPRGKK